MYWHAVQVISTIALVGITSWYAVSTHRMLKLLTRQLHLHMLSARVAGYTVLVGSMYDEGRAKTKIKEILAELERDNPS